MTEEQYVDSMLKLAYLSGFEMAKRDMEKQALTGMVPTPSTQKHTTETLAQPGPVRQKTTDAPSQVARNRGPSKLTGSQSTRMAGGPLSKNPRSSFKQPGPGMAHGYRGGKNPRLNVPNKTTTSVASQKKKKPH